MKAASSIAIVGIGGIFPHASDPSSLWDIVHSASNTAEEPPSGRWILPLEEAYAPEKGLADRVYSRRACFVDHTGVNLDYSRLNINASLVEQLDPVFQLLLHAGAQAFFDTAVVPERLERIGVIAGNLALPTETSARLAQDYLGRTLCEQVLGHYVAPSETAALNRFVTGMPVAVLAHALGLGGTCFTLDAACASSLYALKLAVEELRSGRADVMLAGGVARPDSLYTQMGFSQLRALSPSGTCSPFDRNGDGLVVGEGAGMVVLKRTADAVRAGDHIYATIEGIGLSNDIGGSLLAPTSEGQLRAMRAAYAEANWNPCEVELIECHATGTPVGDAVEVESLCQLWNENPERHSSTKGAACVLGSVKSNIGHLLTAAGSAALIKTLLAMKHKTLPPTANHTTPLERLDGSDVPFRVLSEAQPWECQHPSGLRRAAVSAFGFGGINAHVLLQEWDKHKCTQAYSNAETGKNKASDSTRSEGIAIVGLDVRTGATNSTAAFRTQVLGQTRNTELQQPEHWGGAQQSKWWDTEDFNPCYGAYIREVSLPAGKFRIPPTEMRDMLPRQALMLLCAESALEDAGVNGTDHASSGVFIGTGLDFNATSFSLRWRLPSLYQQWQDEGIENLPPLDKLLNLLSEPLNANRTMGALGSVVASRIARAFGVGGPSFTLASEENSGLHAVECACNALQRGEIDLAIAGGVDMPGDIRTQLSNQRLGFELPVADAACALILKRLEDAQADGDSIYAVIDAHASTTGAQNNLLYTAADTRARTLEQLCYASEGRTSEYAFSEICTLSDAESGTEYIHTIPTQVQIGYAGEAGSILALAKTALALKHKIIPPRQQHPGESMADYWIHDAASGPRRALVQGYAAGGSVCLVDVREAEVHGSSDISPLPGRFPLACPEDDISSTTLFRVYGADSAELITALQRLKDEAQHEQNLPLAHLARRWDHLNPNDRELCVSCVATDHAELEAQIDFAQQHLHHTPGNRLDGKGGARIPACARDKVFYSPDPLGAHGKIAFVFPGSGNHFVNMGRDLARTWPDIFERQHRNNDYLRRQYRPEEFWNGKELKEIEEDHNSMIIAHVAMCTALSDRVRLFGVEPEIAVGYSLGESSSLFSLGVWRERDEMLRRIEASPLFTRDLGGECAAARTLWGLGEDEAVDWCLGIVPMPREQIEPCISNIERAYLLIVNTPEECVIGGQRQAVKQVLEGLGNPAFIELNGVTTVHCPVPEVVADAYHALHRFDTHAVDCDIFSCASGSSYTPGSQACADAILAQATDTIDFTRVINNAYAAGARIFIETGSGNSCTRMLPRILGESPHMVRPTCVEGQDSLTTFSTLIAQLEAEGIRCNIEDLRLPDVATQSDFSDAEHKGMVHLRNGINKIVPPPPDSTEVDEKHLSCAYASRDLDLGSNNTGVKSTDRNTGYVCPCTSNSSPVYNDNHGTNTAQDTLGTNKSHSGDSMTDLACVAMESIQQIQVQHSAAHAEFLRLSTELHAMMAENIRLQQEYAAEWNADAVESFAQGSAPPAQQPPLNSSALQPLPGAATPLYDREACMEFAVGAIGNMLGGEFAAIDSHPTRVRLPDEPLMLVDRIVHLEGEPCSMGSGRVITEHDVTSERWYLDGGHIPTCVAVEAGQADLFLSAYLGIDLKTKGKAMYRLLDAVVKFHSHLPCPGDIIRYDIRIERFFRQGDTWLFKFNFESTVNGAPLLSMRDGCAGFFTPDQLNDGRGVVHTELDRRPIQGTYSSDWRTLIPMDEVEQYSAAQIEALRQGDLTACFGAVFANLPLQQPYTLPGGHLELVDRVTHLDPHGGRYGIGQIKAEMDIDPQDWFLTCHFCDDNVMPGTLMYECCLHTLRVFLMRMGWVTEVGEGHWEPIPGVDSQLKCRGQVTEHTRSVTYEVNVKEIGYRPEPYAIVDALMYADSKAIVEITNMTIQLSGLSREAMEKRWAQAAAEPAQGEKVSHSDAKKPPLFDYASILAFSNGKPSEAFGEPYRVFDSERRIARLPRPPFQFLDRITAVDATQWKMVAGGSAEAQYDVPPDAWYFTQERSNNMPFSVLLEIALQPCGWLAAYVGSALTSDVDLCFRNLDGNAQKLRPVTNSSGTLTTRVKLTRVSSSGGMIIQSYDFEVCDAKGPVYRGDTVFGFFSEQALANQVGIQGLESYIPAAEELQRSIDPEHYPAQFPFPDVKLRMLDHIDAYIPDGGPQGLGFLRASKTVDPKEWFFEAHFYQDPVCPGSLGLESFIQLIKYAAIYRWGADESTAFEVTALNTQHHWSYRGQIIPSNREIQVVALISAIDDEQRCITADGFLSVDGKIIYSMQDFCVNITTKKQ